MKPNYYLIPCEQNNYRPWITSRTALALFSFLVWSIRFMIPANITVAQSSIDATELMTRINTERINRFIPALTTNSMLITAATAKSNDMIQRSYFAHVDPDGNYVWPRIEAAGYTPYVRLGENLAMDFTSAADVVREWMNSPTHRANIINGNFEDQGLASIYGLFEPNHDSILITSLFGTLAKRSSAPIAGSANPTPPPAPRPAPAPAPVPAPAPLPTPHPEPITSGQLPQTNTGNPQGNVPVSAESQTAKTLRIVFGIFAGLYMVFLVIDSIIIHRMRIKRDGLHSGAQSLVFFLIATVNLILAIT